MGLGVRLLLACASLFLAAGVPTVARAQEKSTITVRLLDVKSGKPIRKCPVGIIQWKPDAPHGAHAEDVAATQSSRTDGNGEVVVKLADPLPGSIGIVFSDLVNEDTSYIDIRDVLKSGVVLRVDLKTRQWIRELTGKPGEIVIFNRKRSLWERILREVP